MAVADEFDEKLINLLIADGRKTFADLGEHVALSQPAIKRRVDRLVATGVISGFTAVVDHARMGRPVEVFTELSYRGNTSPEEMERLRNDVPEVEAMYILAGDFDALCHIRARDNDHLREIIGRLRATPGVIGTKTLLVLASANTHGSK